MGCCCQRFGLMGSIVEARNLMGDWLHPDPDGSELYYISDSVLGGDL